MHEHVNMRKMSMQYIPCLLTSFQKCNKLTVTVNSWSCIKKAKIFFLQSNYKCFQPSAGNLRSVASRNKMVFMDFLAKSIKLTEIVLSLFKLQELFKNLQIRYDQQRKHTTEVRKFSTIPTSNSVPELPSSTSSTL